MILFEIVPSEKKCKSIKNFGKNSSILDYGNCLKVYKNQLIVNLKTELYGIDLINEQYDEKYLNDGEILSFDVAEGDKGIYLVKERNGCKLVDMSSRQEYDLSSMHSDNAQICIGSKKNEGLVAILWKKEKFPYESKKIEIFENNKNLVGEIILDRYHDINCFGFFDREIYGIELTDSNAKFLRIINKRNRWEIGKIENVRLEGRVVNWVKERGNKVEILSNYGEIVQLN